MALSVKQLVRRRGALVAAVTSAGVFVAILATQTTRVLIDLVVGGIASWEPIAQNALAYALPIGLGVFLSLWLILPIDGELELRFVVTRAIGALIPAVVLLFVAQSIFYGVIAYAQVTQSDLGGLMVTGPAPLSVEWFGGVLLTGLRSALNGALTVAPLVVLAAIFQWNWLKHHPAKFEVAGILDV